MIVTYEYFITRFLQSKHFKVIERCPRRFSDMQTRTSRDVLNMSWSVPINIISLSLNDLVSVSPSLYNVPVSKCPYVLYMSWSVPICIISLSQNDPLSVSPSLYNVPVSKCLYVLYMSWSVPMCIISLFLNAPVSVSPSLYNVPVSKCPCLCVPISV